MADCFLSETEYEDPSIHVTITSGFEHDSKYHIAHIQIANASQIRSVMSGSYSNSSETNPVRLCNTVHPVFAINGDFFTQKYGHHVIVQSSFVRQGARPAIRSIHNRSIKHPRSFFVKERT